MTMADTWFMIPARAGSRGIPRKNLQLLDGKPLILHVIDTVLSITDEEKVVLVTDSDEIALICRAHAPEIRFYKISPQTGKETLDEVAVTASRRLIDAGANPEDIFLTVQATCPFLRGETILEAVKGVRNGARSVLTVCDDRHLRWKEDDEGKPVPAFTARVNRQFQEPTYRETGSIIGARIRDILDEGTRILDPIHLVHQDGQEALDIDEFADLAVARYELSRKKFAIRADASPGMGMGHVYRALALAHELASNDIMIATRGDGDYELGAAFFDSSPFDAVVLDQPQDFLAHVKEFRPDVVFVDTLDTQVSDIRELREAGGAAIVTFEDLGEGASEADVVVNELYSNERPGVNQLNGVDYAVLAPGFDLVAPREEINSKVDHILLIFGGTDPSGLTELALAALAEIKFGGHVTVVQGLGRKGVEIDLSAFGLNGEVLRNVSYMPQIMRDADLAISSAGRTVTELMSLGIPTLVMCQNERELLHSHASPNFGVLNLGLGVYLGTSTLAKNIDHLLQDEGLRRHMHDLAVSATASRSNAECVRTILSHVGVDL